MKYVCYFSLMVLSMFPAVAETHVQVTDEITTELGTGQVERTGVRGKEWMVASANPHASEAGAMMLRAGGNAIDAMVAVQVVLGLVEPQSSGIGGGALLVYWDNKEKSLISFDGRETAPKDAKPTLFQDDNGEPLEFYDAVVGGRSVGTPGTLRLMYDTHAKYGKLAWLEVLRPAIELAEKGFEVSPRLAKLIAGDADKLRRYPTTARYFFNQDGTPLAAGQRLVNRDYADTLRLAAQNIDNFYKGKIAADIVATVQGATGNPGVLSSEDLENYRIVERETVCIPYLQYRICGMGPPTSGTITIGQILGIVGYFPMKSLGKDNPESWRLIGEASRLAFADRGRYLADSDFVPVPVRGLLRPEYLKARAALIPERGLIKDVTPGEPLFSHAQVVPYADDESIELPSTSHFSIVDNEGNVVSITTTIENGFGSRLMTRGFLLNNELTDFSFRTHREGYPIANRLEPGKRPRSSMSPIIVMKDDRPYLSVGSPGGSRIIGYVAKTLIAHLDWGLDIQSAIDLPHLVNRFGVYDLEKATAAENFKPALEAMGYQVDVRDLTSGLHGIVIDSGILEGGADPRREGLVVAN